MPCRVVVFSNLAVKKKKSLGQFLKTPNVQKAAWSSTQVLVV